MLAGLAYIMLVTIKTSLHKYNSNLPQTGQQAPGGVTKPHFTSLMGGHWILLHLSVTRIPGRKSLWCKNFLLYDENHLNINFPILITSFSQCQLVLSEINNKALPRRCREAYFISSTAYIMGCLFPLKIEID